MKNSQLYKQEGFLCSQSYRTGLGADIKITPNISITEVTENVDSDYLIGESPLLSEMVDREQEIESNNNRLRSDRKSRDFFQSEIGLMMLESNEQLEYILKKELDEVATNPNNGLAFKSKLVNKHLHSDSGKKFIRYQSESNTKSNRKHNQQQIESSSILSFLVHEDRVLKESSNDVCFRSVESKRDDRAIDEKNHSIQTFTFSKQQNDPNITDTKKMNIEVESIIEKENCTQKQKEGEDRLRQFNSAIDSFNVKSLLYSPPKSQLLFFGNQDSTKSLPGRTATHGSLNTAKSKIGGLGNGYSSPMRLFPPQDSQSQQKNLLKTGLLVQNLLSLPENPFANVKSCSMTYNSQQPLVNRLSKLAKGSQEYKLDLLQGNFHKTLDSISSVEDDNQLNFGSNQHLYGIKPANIGDPISQYTTQQSIIHNNNNQKMILNATLGSASRSSKCINKSKRMKSSQLIKEGRLDEALIEVNLMLKNTAEISKQSSCNNSISLAHSFMVNQSNANSGLGINCTSSNNKKAFAYYLRGQIFEKRGEFMQAIKDFKQALQIDPTLINAAFAKAACENKIGNYEDAINTYNEAFAMESAGSVADNGIQAYNAIPQSQSSNTNNIYQDTSYYKFNSNNFESGQLTASAVSSNHNENKLLTEVNTVVQTNLSLDNFNLLNRMTTTELASLHQTTTSSDPFIFTSRIEAFSPQTLSRKDSFTSSTVLGTQLQNLNQNYLREQSQRIISSGNEEIKSDIQEPLQVNSQSSKFGKIQINLKNFAKKAKIQTATSDPQTHENENKISDTERSIPRQSDIQSIISSPKAVIMTKDKRIEFFVSSPIRDAIKNSATQNNETIFSKNQGKGMMMTVLSKSHNNEYKNDVNYNVTQVNPKTSECTNSSSKAQALLMSDETQNNNKFKNDCSSTNNISGNIESKKYANPYQIIRERRLNKSRENTSKLIKNHNSHQILKKLNLQSNLGATSSLLHPSGILNKTQSNQHLSQVTMQNSKFSAQTQSLIQFPMANAIKEKFSLNQTLTKLKESNGTIASFSNSDVHGRGACSTDSFAFKNSHKNQNKQPNTTAIMIKTTASNTNFDSQVLQKQFGLLNGCRTNNNEMSAISQFKVHEQTSQNSTFAKHSSSTKNLDQSKPSSFKNLKTITTKNSKNNNNVKQRNTTVNIVNISIAHNTNTNGSQQTAPTRNNNLFAKQVFSSQGKLTAKSNNGTCNGNITNQLDLSSVSSKQKIKKLVNPLQATLQNPQQIFQLSTSRSSTSRFNLQEGQQKNLYSQRGPGVNSARRVEYQLRPSCQSDRSASRSQSGIRSVSNNRQGKPHSNAISSQNTIGLKSSLARLRTLLKDKKKGYQDKCETLFLEIEDKYLKNFTKSNNINKTSQVSNCRCIDIYQTSDSLQSLGQQYFVIKASYLYSQKKIKECLNILDKKVCINTNPDAYLMNIRCLAKLSLEDSSIEEVQKFLMYSTTLSDDKLTLEGYYIKGKLMIKKGDWKSAVINFNNAQILDENMIKIQARRALCFMMLGQEKRAQEDIHSVTELVSIENHKYLISMIQNLETFQSLRQLLLEVIDSVSERVKTKNHSAYFQLMLKKAQIIAKYDKDPEKGLLLLEGLERKSPQILEYMSELQYKLKNYKGSLEYLNQMQDQSKTIKVAYLKAKVLLKQEEPDFKKVLKEVNMIVSAFKDPEESNSQHQNIPLTNKQLIKSLKMKGFCFLMLGKYEKCVALFNELITQVTSIDASQVPTKDQSDVIQKFKNDILRECYTYRGKAYQKLMMFDQAVKDFSQLIENRSLNDNRKSLAETLLLRAMSYEAVGDQKKCQQDLQKAIEEAYPKKIEEQ